MRAMLLCAGVGERMLPLTRRLPKPALPVLGRPIVLTNLERLARGGFETLVVNLHHLPDVLRRVIDDASPATRPAVRFAEEPTILGTAGALRGAAHLLRGEGTFLVHNGDFLSDVDLAAALEAHRRSGMLATLVLAAARDGYSRVEVDDAGRVLAIAGRPGPAGPAAAGSYLFTGMQILQDEVIDRIPADTPSDIIRDVHLGLLGEGRLGSYVHRGFWWEFGDPETFLEGCLRLIEMPDGERARVGTTDRVRDLEGARVAVGALADFHTGVQLERRVALGYGTRVSEGSWLADSVVMPEVWIGPGSRLERVLVGPGTEIPAGFEARDALVCQEAADPPEGTEGLLVRSFRAP